MRRATGCCDVLHPRGSIKMFSLLEFLSGVSIIETEGVIRWNLVLIVIGGDYTRFLYGKYDEL